MGKLIDGDDGLPAEEVGIWAKEKHDYLCRYIDISRSMSCPPFFVFQGPMGSIET